MSTYLFQTLVILFFELVLNISTKGCFEVRSLFIMALFALAGGLFWELLINSIKNIKVRVVVRFLLLLAFSVIYSIEFFIYRSFNVFYDVNTVLNGAGGVIGGFMGDVGRLVFCFDGILHVVLFFFPPILYIFVLRKNEWKLPKNVFSILCPMIICFVGAYLLVVSSNVHSLMYDKEYNFQTVVENMGLGVGIRLDIMNIMEGDDTEAMFESEAAVMPVTVPTPEPTSVPLPTEPTAVSTPEPTPTPRVFYDNAYDIDYEALAETTSGINADLDRYVATLTPSKQNEFTGLFEGKNLILISAEAFSGEVIDPELTPTLYRLSTKGIQFTDFIQPAIAGTTGGEYANLFGLIPTEGGKSLSKMTSGDIFQNMGYMLNEQGYFGKTYHDNSGNVYDRDTTHNRLGYSEGFEGVGSGMENYISSHGFPASDDEMIIGTMNEYMDHQPFNIYYMTVSGHGQYGTKINNMSARNYDRVKDLDYSELVKCYIANNLALEDAMTSLVNELERRGIEDDTVICISPDHFPYGLDNDGGLGKMPYLSELYGYDVVNYLQRDHNTWILWSGCLEDDEPIVIDSPTSSLDILPTLLNLFGCKFDSRLYPGRDVFSDAMALSFNGSYDWKTDLGTYYSSKNTFVPKDENTKIPDDYVNNVKVIVRNKFTFCKGVLKNDYYGHIHQALENAPQ